MNKKQTEELLKMCLSLIKEQGEFLEDSKSIQAECFNLRKKAIELKIKSFETLNKTR